MSKPFPPNFQTSLAKTLDIATRTEIENFLSAYIWTLFSLKENLIIPKSSTDNDILCSYYIYFYWTAFTLISNEIMIPGICWLLIYQEIEFVYTMK